MPEQPPPAQAAFAEEALHANAVVIIDQVHLIRGLNDGTAYRYKVIRTWDLQPLLESPIASSLARRLRSDTDGEFPIPKAKRPSISRYWGVWLNK
jgi:hypothetical protein